MLRSESILNLDLKNLTASRSCSSGLPGECDIGLGFFCREQFPRVIYTPLHQLPVLGRRRYRKEVEPGSSAAFPESADPISLQGDLVPDADAPSISNAVCFLSDTASRLHGPLSARELTPWNIILLGKLIIAHLVKKLPAFCGPRLFITVLTRPLSRARWMQSTPKKHLSYISLPSIEVSTQ
jgi:hypothetical protein